MRPSASIRCMIASKCCLRLCNPQWCSISRVTVAQYDKAQWKQYIRKRRVESLQDLLLRIRFLLGLSVQTCYDASIPGVGWLASSCIVKPDLGCSGNYHSQSRPSHDYLLPPTVICFAACSLRLQRQMNKFLHAATVSMVHTFDSRANVCSKLAAEELIDDMPTIIKIGPIISAASAQY